MSVDGLILSDLRRVLSEARPSPFFFLVCGPSGSGKTFVLHAVRQGAGAYGMSVSHGVPLMDDGVEPEKTEWNDSKARIFYVDYNALRSNDSRAPSISENYPAGTVVLLDDIEAVDYLLRLNASLHRLEEMVCRLLRSPRCALVTSATDVLHVPRWLLAMWTPFTYKMHELTSSAARRLIRSFPDAEDLLAFVSGENGEELVSYLRTRRALTLMLCHALCEKNKSWVPTSHTALHFLGHASIAPQLPSSSRGKLFGLGPALERVETLVRLFMERENLAGRKLLATVAPTTGILLHGPSGSGKTAIASRVSASYPGKCFLVSCAALFSKYLGESEERLREAFRKARLCAPSVLVLDDVDVIGTSRGAFLNGGTGDGLNVTKRMLAALLCELDGLIDNKRVLVIATTNVPGTLDVALLRQGRFETVVYVPPLSFEAAEEMALEFFGAFDGAEMKAREELSRFVAGRAEGCAAASLKAFLREVFEQQQRHQEMEVNKTARVKAGEGETALFLPSEALWLVAWFMEYKSTFELRQQVLDLPTHLTSRARTGKKNSSSNPPCVPHPLNANNNGAVMDSDPDDPTALVRELPALDKLNALSASLKNEEEVQNYVEARNLSLEDTAKYIMANGSTGQKMSLFQRLKETLVGLDMSCISQVLMIAVDSMWVQEPELQCFAPGALIEVLPLLNNTVTRDLLMVTSTMLSVKTAEVRIAWNKLFSAFIDYLNNKQLDNDVVPLALKKTEHVEPQDQRELSCDLIGAVCRYLPHDIVERKLMNKVLALCQDTNVGVRQHMCQQLGIVARALGVDMAKEKIAPELFELLNDEDQTVSRAAFSCLVDLVEFFGPAYRREHLYPIIKNFISHPPEEVVSLIVGEYGRFLWEIRADIQTSEDVTLFAGFYQNAALKGDEVTRHRCAYNLPSVTASLPISVFALHLAPCCEALATDTSEPVRRSIAAGLHELVALLGEKAALYLQKPFLWLLDDSQKSVLNALSTHSHVLMDAFVKQLKPTERMAFFSSVEDVLLRLVARAEREWRIMDHVLDILSTYCKEFQETTLYEKFIPLLLKYGRNGAFCLKNRCAEMCIKIVANMSNVNSKVQFFSKLNNEYAHGSSCLGRKDYLRFVRAACSLFSRRFIRERMLECCFELQHDQMDMVRLELARTLPCLGRVLELSTSGSAFEEYQDMIHRLQMDESSEVRALTQSGLEIIELRDRGLKRDAGRIKFEEENREDRRREQAEGQLLDVAKEYDKAERRSKLRDLLKTEREKEQTELVRKSGTVRRLVKGATVQATPTKLSRPIPKTQTTHSGGATFQKKVQR